MRGKKEENGSSIDGREWKEVPRQMKLSQGLDFIIKESRKV
jgi:hypothetical protein